MPRKSKNTARRLAQAPKKPRSEPRVAKTAAQPKVRTSTLSNTKGGRGDGTMEMVKRRLDPKSPQNRKKPTKSKSKKPRLK